MTNIPNGSGLDRNEIVQRARERSARLIVNYQSQIVELEPRYLIQMAHLTVPATVWKYVEKAVTRSRANLVMLDLEDSIPGGNLEMLELGRANVIRALSELEWGSRLRFFRPRGLDLDPAHEDLAAIIGKAGGKLDGIVYPKIEGPEEVACVDATLSDLESTVGLVSGAIRIELLIESANAVENVFEIARTSRRLVGLVFGSYDYWASLGLGAAAYRADHHLLNYARTRIVQAAAAVGVPAIAEMTTNYPTRDKSEEDILKAVEEFKRDCRLAIDYGFQGKWTGIPEQTELAAELFQIGDDEISAATEEARLFLEAEQGGRGAAMIGGRMADRATDRVNRTVLKKAFALGRLDETLARQLGLI